MLESLSSQIEWPRRLFITGIDTDAGKSYATGQIALSLLERGESVITQKFVQTGNVGRSEDIEVHRRIMGRGTFPEDEEGLTAPIIFSYPASPDLAARIDGKTLDLSLADKASDILASRYDHLLIEGAGGLMVPLEGEYLTIDYIRSRRLPALLVTNGRLGSINHTLLSLYAIKEYGIPLFAIIYNSFFDSDKRIAEDTRHYIDAFRETHFPESHLILI